jgi:MerR family transcriptional regulator, light-induced transcriptional regulator
MSAIRTTAAAAMLGVSPSTLRSWERRFGFPAPRRSEGGHRMFDREDIEALRVALAEAGGLGAAVALARDRGTGPSTPSRLEDALARFDDRAADRLLEESLAVRSVERTVGEVLLPAVDALVARTGAGSPEHGLAFRWATGWLAAAARLAPPATREEGVLVFDASAPPDVDALHVQALELCLRRRGVRVLVLAAGLQSDRLGRAVTALRPGVVVLSGARASLDEVGRLVFAARRAGAAGADVVDFRGAVPDTGASTVGRLPASALAAADAVLERLLAPAAGAARAV